MTVGEKLDALLTLARSDAAVKEALLAARADTEPMERFCEVSTSLGFALTVGELITAGEEYSCNQLKSTNGGGVNPYEYYDDLYDNFYVALFF